MCSKPTDIRLRGAELFFIPVQTRVPLKFGTETLTSVTCARVRVLVEDRQGKLASGWGETPLSVQWVWPSELGYAHRHNALKDFCEELTSAWVNSSISGHPLEIGYEFQQRILRSLYSNYNQNCEPHKSMPILAALVCCSPFDLAIHDAFGNIHDIDIYKTYNSEYMNRDLSYFFDSDSNSAFEGKYPSDFLAPTRKNKLPVWHLVGGLDPLNDSQIIGERVNDSQPELLDEWIDQDGLNCFKVKLRGNDARWDYNRIIDIARIAESKGPYFLSTDFNCTVTEPTYVNSILDQILEKEPSVFNSILYVEQPFPYDLEKHSIDVHSLTSRKPLLMDESAHSWEYVRLGQTLGWDGVALKTCKTQTGALLMLCWAKAHGMHVMVQDLTNPMLAQIPHVLLAAHADTMMGVESNAMQFYPNASSPEAKVHPGLYQRRDGLLDLSTIEGPGFGYRVEEIQRNLGNPVAREGIANG